MKIIPSIYQEAVYEEIRTGTGNIVIRAVAGSGKTTTIVEALKLISVRQKIVFCAFNNAIVDELKSRCPSHVRVTTLHSLGWHSMKRYYGNDIKLNASKGFNLAERMFKWSVPKHLRAYHCAMLSKLVDLYRLNLARGEDQLIQLADKHAIDYSEMMIEQAMMLFENMVSDTHTFDFTDMIYVPAILDDVQMNRYDYIFVDECQDLNLAQQKLILRSKNKTARVISVGDPNQAIYGFAGADAHSFQRLVDMPNTKLLPLSVCYRCSKAIVEKAQEIVEEIEPFESSPEGTVREGSVMEIRSTDWVLCRNVRPLVVLCVDMLSKGKRAHVKGSDIGRAIIALLRKTGETGYKAAMRKLFSMLRDTERELAKHGVDEPQKHPRYQTMKERISVILFLGRGCVSSNQIVDKLERIFKEQEGGTLLSTIHKAKGLENDRVFIICPELMPSRFATQPWQLEQESNLRYVAYTRAKKELVIVNDFNENVLDFRTVKAEESSLQ